MSAPARRVSRLAVLRFVLSPSRLIALKRDGGELSREQIAWLVRSFVSGEMAESQMSAFCMAVFFRGMSDEETTALTQEMLESGVTMSHPAGSAVVDKHSTGGVGDKTSLILAPLLASCGLRVPMISGRGLGPTGGTLDKLESIPGFRTDLSMKEVADVGCVITGATTDLVPADRKLYALRDVTATVPSVPLITASIMSKKLAESLDALVLDVKFGSGAFMKTREQATQLAKSLVRVGNLSGLKTTALITDMNQPLGQMCGNSVEVAESLDVLAGRGPDDVRQLTIALGAELLVTSGLHKSLEAATVELCRQLDSGAALNLFRRMVAAQGGDLDVMPKLAPEIAIEATQSGFVSAVDTEELGLAIIELGGGRKQADDRIDHSVGIEVLCRVGDSVSQGDSLARVFGNGILPASIAQVRDAFEICKDEVEPRTLIVDRVSFG